MKGKRDQRYLLKPFFPNASQKVFWFCETYMAYKAYKACSIIASWLLLYFDQTWLTLFHKINIFQYNFQPNRLFHIPRVLRLNGKYIAFLSPFLLFPFPLHPSYALARWAFCVNAPQPLSKITNNQPPILIHRTAIDFLLCSSGPTVLIFYFY